MEPVAVEVIGVVAGVAEVIGRVVGVTLLAKLELVLELAPALELGVVLAPELVEVLAEAAWMDLQEIGCVVTLAEPVVFPPGGSLLPPSLACEPAAGKSLP